MRRQLDEEDHVTDKGDWALLVRQRCSLQSLDTRYQKSEGVESRLEVSLQLERVVSRKVLKKLIILAGCMEAQNTERI